LCLDYLKSARIRREQYVGSWVPEPLLTDTRVPLDSPLDDSLSMAFLLLLERLSPPERAVFLAIYIVANPDKLSRLPLLS
jgi:RNA polymerase sigma-70 factor, ECF subfamily